MLARLIGQRWKNIDPDRLAKYSEMASEDTERYKNEMQTYNGRQEAKMRSEALKPPAVFPGASAAGRGVDHYGGGPPPGMEPGRGPPMYPDQMATMSAFANPSSAGMGPAGYSPYGSMDFGGYGAMGMGGYGMGAYGAPYGMGGPQDAMGMGGGMDPSAYGRGAGGGYGAMGMMGGGFQGGMMGYG